MDYVILLAVPASVCTATASLCQRKGARSTQTAGFDVRLVFRLARQPVWLLVPSPVPINWYASVPYSIAGLRNCAYILTLVVNVLLTDGVNVPDPIWDQIAFCKT